MSEPLTTAQRQRLLELSAPDDALDAVFPSAAERDAFFKVREKQYAEQNRQMLVEMLETKRRPLLLDIEDMLSAWLRHEQGFTQVTTPTFITAEMLARMSIDGTHPLSGQVFWLDGRRCLRPMLAPNLYEMMGRLRRITRKPVRIFEAGACFRKESQGARHLNEFTMLNLVELAGVADGEQPQRLAALAHGAMAALGIANYELVTERSEVYGETLDIVVDGEEVASGAFGPHPLDDAWRICDPWVGIGFGLERVAMVKAGHRNIRGVGKGLMYLDGARLNV